MKDVKIVVATHKKYKMPQSEYYLPIHVGREIRENIGYIGDNTGDNISKKVLYYGELTGLYWAWKNLKNEYIGLVHYRRHFKGENKKKKNLYDCILSKREIDELLERTDIILTKKRNYYIETLYNHFKNTMYIEVLDIAGEIIKEKYREYYPFFEKLYERKSAHMFNIMIMKGSYLNLYCEWLFNILKELEKRADINKYDSFHARSIGRVGELLLDIWIEKNEIKYIEVPILNTEKINWVYKGSMFLLSKFTERKYIKSF